ncbi:MAG: pentapeptide repeat-containing protein [Prosthecobacter sp.]
MNDHEGNPPTAEPLPPKALTAHSASKQVIGIISIAISLLLGGGLGAALVLSIEHLGAQIRFFGWMAIFAAVAAALLLIGALGGITRWIWRHRGHYYFCETRLAFYSLIDKPPDLAWSAHLSLVWQNHRDSLMNALFVTVTLWAGLALISPIVMGLFSFASYLSSQAQVQVTDTQNRIVAIEQEFQQANAYAEQRFEQISKVLHDEDSTPGQQVYALREVPDAMLVIVPRAILDDSSARGVRILYTLPNLRRLRDVVRQFVSMDRVAATMNRSHQPHKKSQPLTDAALEALEPLHVVTIELIHLLHRLGPIDATRPDHCLWNWDPKAMKTTGSFLEVDEADELPSPRPFLKDGDPGFFDLSHLGERDLEQLVAPGLFNNQNKRMLVWNSKVSLAGAQLQGSWFLGAQLQGIDLRGVNLQGALMSGAQLQGANLRGAHLQGAKLIASSFEGVDFTGSQLQGVSFFASNLKERISIQLDCMGRISVGHRSKKPTFRLLKWEQGIAGSTRRIIIPLLEFHLRNFDRQDLWLQSR